MGGVTTLPGGAFYHASKHAVESFSDALRIEVAPFGVQVVLIEPGPVRTPWNDTAADSIGAAVSTPEDPYAEFKAAVGASFSQVTGGRLTRLVSTPEDVAEVIVRAVAVDRPHTRYLINPVGRAMVAMKRLLPDRVHDAVLRQQYHLPR
jgi:short-subunit dehydrogenase